MNVESALKFVIMHLPKSGLSSTPFFFEGISEPEKHYSLLLAKINYNTLLFYISGIICCHYNEECVKNKKLKKKMRTSVSLLSYYAYCWVPKPGIL